MEMINIGRINGTHNLNGAVKMTTSFMHFDNLIGEKVLIETIKGPSILTIKQVKKMTDKKYIITFNEIKTIDDAKLLKGSVIKIRENLIPEIDDDELYVEDLVSFKVYEKGQYIGDIVDIMNTNAHEILVVLNDDKEILIPYVEDVFIDSVEIKDKKVNVNLLEGML